MSTQTSLFGESEPERKKSKAPPKIEKVVGEGFDVKKFVESFEPIADAAGSVEALRAFVLRLALRGRLSDGSLNVQTGLPDDWSWLRLDEASTWAGGSGFPTQAQGHTDRPFLFCKVSDMNLAGNERFIVTTANTIDAETAKRVRAKLHPAGTVIFPKIGGAIATNKRRVLTRPGAIDNNCLGVIPNGKCSSEFLLLIMRDIDLTEYQNDGPVPALNQGRIGAIEVAVPPLAEQKRIVAKVDELMALIDDLETKQTKKRAVGARFTKSALDALTSAEGPEEFDAAWKRVVENFDVLIDRAEKVAEVRAHIVELAMRGRLTRSALGDRNVADDLSARTRAPGFSARGQLAPIEDDVPFSIPGTWRWVRWGTLSEGTSSGWSPQCESRARVGSEWGVLKVSAVSWFSFRPEENKALPLALEPRPEFAVRPGDFLMSRANTAELVGRSVVVAEVSERLILSDKIIRCEFCALVEKQFINLFNRTTAARGHYVRHASGTSDSMKNISREVILTMPIPLPPIEEQRRIVAKVASLMKVCDELEAKLRRAEERAAKLAEAAVRELVA